MGVPFEAFLPYGIMLGMFGVTGVGLSTIRYYTNGEKRTRWNLDQWDRQMMERDYRLTGVFRGQSDAVGSPSRLRYQQQVEDGEADSLEDDHD